MKVRHKKCVQCNIKKALFNLKNEYEQKYCKDCKTTNMIKIHKNNYSKKCEKCNTVASFGYEDIKKMIRCSEHKESNMVNLKKEICELC